MNLPNKLTILRILLVPVLLILIYNINNSLAMSVVAVVTFLLISFTDMLDGKIARSRNLVTDFGKFLDPLADKILVTSVMIAFIDMGYISSLAVIIIIMREFMVTSLRLVASSGNKVIAASNLGKLKTVIQMFVLTVLFFCPQISALPFGGVLLLILEWIMVAITVISGVDYLWKNREVILASK